MDFKKTQAYKTFCALRHRDCPKGDGKNQIKRTAEKIRGKP